MKIEFKAWDKKNKKMIYPHTIPMQAGECCFSIDLNGMFYVKERSNLIAPFLLSENFVERDSSDFELLQWIGLTSKDNKKIFPRDIIADENGNKMIVGYGQYKSSKDSWGVEPTHFGCFIEFEDGNKLGLTQEGSGYSIASGECDHLGHSYEQKNV